MENGTSRIEQGLVEVNSWLMDIEKTLIGKEPRLDRQIEMGTKADRLLDEYLGRLLADRVDVFMFKGDEGTTPVGFGLVRCAHTFQTFHKGCVSHSLKELPLTFVPEFFCALKSHGTLVIDSDSKAQEYGQTFTQWLDGTEAEAIAFAILRVGGKLAGFVAASYDLGGELPIDEKRLPIEMITLAAKLEAVLSAENQ